MSKSIIVLFSLMVCLTSCEELANQTLPTDVVFFDLKKFIANEVVRLNKLNPEIEKTTRVNEHSETKTMRLENFQSELKIFQEADINKLAWIDKYTSDTSFVDNQMSAIVYNATEEKLTTRVLKVDYTNGQVSKIDLRTKAASIVTDVEKHLIYEPNGRYFILSKQKTMGSDENEIEIEGKFVN